MKLLIATANPGKLAEIREFLSDLPIELLSLQDIECTDVIKETGKTFEENAILKATYYFTRSGLPTIADDGGFEIDALGGAPGVRSHRWMSGEEENDDEELIAYTLKKMKGLPPVRRGAQLRSVIALVISTDAVYTAEGVIRGIVPEQASTYRMKGFPYRSLLYLPECNAFYNEHELTNAENEAYNHRKKAIEKIKPIIRTHLLR